MEHALYLIPSPMQEGNLQGIPQDTINILLKLRHLVVENIKPARRYIAAAAKANGQRSEIIGDYTFYELGKDTKDNDLMNWVIQGEPIGIVSDAGCPGVADPGARLVNWAHEMGVKVVPLVGPSSILMAVMASGMQGQSFCFNGYLPVNSGERKKELKRLEANSFATTQVFMETPYRNPQMLDACLEVLRPQTRLAVAADLNSQEQYIKSAPVNNWRRNKLPDLKKRPAIFLLSAGG